MRVKRGPILLTVASIVVVLVGAVMALNLFHLFSSSSATGRYLTYYPEHLMYGGNETKIFLLDSSSRYGSYSESFHTMYSGEVNKGDPCVIVSLTIRNDYTEYKPSGYFVSLTAGLYDKDGKVIGGIIQPPSLLGSMIGGFAEFNLQNGETATVNIFFTYDKTVDTKNIDHYDIYVMNIQDAPTP